MNNLTLGMSGKTCIVFLAMVSILWLPESFAAGLAGRADGGPSGRSSYTPPSYSAPQSSGNSSGAFSSSGDSDALNRYQQKALNDQAEAMKRQAAQQEAQERREQQQREAVERTQQLIQAQQQQREQLQNTINETANRVGQSIANDRGGNDNAQPSAVWDNNRQEYRSRDGGPPPIITYTKPDGTVDYSGIPVEAVDPSAQPNVYYRRGPSNVQLSSDYTQSNNNQNSQNPPANRDNSSTPAPTPVNYVPAQQPAIEPEPARPLFDLSSWRTPAPDSSAPSTSDLFGSPSAASNGSPAPDSPTRLQAASESARELFGSAKEVAHDTGRTLTDELFGQVRNGEEVDFREAARSGITSKLNEMKSQGVEVLDDKTRTLISHLPEDSRFDYQTYYNTFLSPKTRMVTPFQAKDHVGAYFQEMVGTKLDDLFGPSQAQ